MNHFSLCTCNNCGGVFYDTNPSNESKEFSHEEIKHNHKELQNYDCPICENDDSLMDITEENYKQFRI